MSPERFKSEKFSFPSDIWSLGLVVLECYLGSFPIVGSRNGYALTALTYHLQIRELTLSLTARSYWDIMNKIVNDEPPTFPPGCGASAEMCDFVACCLKKDPSERATVSHLMEHSWMRLHCAGLTSERKREHISIFIRDLRSIFVTNRSHSSCLCAFICPLSFPILMQNCIYITAGAKATSLWVEI
jgi:serine/threonine protein kinase